MREKGGGVGNKSKKLKRKEHFVCRGGLVVNAA